MGPSIVSGASDELIISAYGGEFEKIYKKTIVEPFEKKFGVKVTYDPAGSSSQKYARIRATKGNPGFDVAAEQAPEDILLGQREGLILPITESDVPENAKIFARARNVIPPYGVMHSLQYVGLLYNPDHLEAPDSWWHYWEAWKKYDEKIKKRILMFNTGNVGTLYLLITGAELAGGGINNMDPGVADVWRRSSRISARPCRIRSRPYPTMRTRRSGYRPIGARVPRFSSVRVSTCAWWPQKRAFTVWRAVLRFRSEPRTRSSPMNS